VRALVPLLEVEVHALVIDLWVKDQCGRVLAHCGALNFIKRQHRYAVPKLLGSSLVYLILTFLCGFVILLYLRKWLRLLLSLRLCCRWLPRHDFDLRLLLCFALLSLLRLGAAASGARTGRF